jgi:hypothetical protein
MPVHGGAAPLVKQDEDNTTRERDSVQRLVGRAWCARASVQYALIQNIEMGGWDVGLPGQATGSEIKAHVTLEAVGKGALYDNVAKAFSRGRPNRGTIRFAPLQPEDDLSRWILPNVPLYRDVTTRSRE